jgi:hypothetical protein
MQHLLGEVLAWIRHGRHGECDSHTTLALSLAVLLLSLWGVGRPAPAVVQEQQWAGRVTVYEDGIRYECRDWADCEQVGETLTHTED